MTVLVRSVFLSLVVLLAACSSGLEQPLPDLTSQDASQTLEIPIRSGSDDAEEALSGNMQLTGGLLDLRANNGNLQSVGTRFQNVAIPRGATIESAFFTTKAGATDSGTVGLKIQGEATDNAAAFNAIKSGISARGKTNASINWWPESWKGGSSYQTNNIGPIIQEIVNRPGWRSGNALALFFSNLGGDFERSAIAFEGIKPATVLVVTFKGGVAALPDPTDPVQPTDPTDPAEPTPSEDPVEPVKPTQPTEPSTPTTPEDPTETTAPTDPTDAVNPVDPTVPSASQSIWHQRLRSSLDSGRYRQGSTKTALDPEYIAATEDSYHYGRNQNMLLTSYVLAYRETGDRKLMDFVNRMMIKMQGAVGDHNGDGFRDILNKRQIQGFYMTDEGNLEEMLSHGTIAGLTLALKQAGYSSTASWWTNYLKNDFTPKRNKRGTKLHPLTHPRANFIRYYYAMYKLTGQSSYLEIAKSEAATVKRTIRSNGWSHYVGRTSGCTPVVYTPLTVIAITDLATNGSGLIDNATMQRAAQTVATKVMNNTSGTTVAADNCGNGSQSNGLGAISYWSLTPAGAWDSSGKIESISERVYNAVERYSLNTPVHTPIPAALAFAKGR